MGARDYTPSAQTEKAMNEFEELIGVPFRVWMIDAVRSGYGSRWMAEKSGIGLRVIRSLCAYWGITRTTDLRPAYGEYGSVQSRMRMEGIYSVRLYDRVIKRVRRGMPYQQAVQQSIGVGRPSRWKENNRSSDSRCG